MIASAAVETAAIAGYEARTGERWSGLDDAGREREEFAAQCALEAAAPHMLAEAWDEGQRAWEDELLGKASGENPYR